MHELFLLLGLILFVPAAMRAADAAPPVPAGTLAAGPMLGYAAHREVAIWIETRKARRIAVEYWLAREPASRTEVTHEPTAATPVGGQITLFRLGPLEMGSEDQYRVRVDDQPCEFTYPLRFKTQPLWEWHAAAPDFAFVFGSCAFLNDPAFDRPGPAYGQGTEIFQHIADSGADFMIWDGDTWYYQEPDFDSVSGLWYRASHQRATPELQRLFASMSHYAIWDDHDYGSNDSNKAYEFKNETLAIFRAYWPNPGSGEAQHPGVFFKFFWSDAAFFLTDDRWYRDDDHLDPSQADGIKTQLGAPQRDWLKQSLLAAQHLGLYPWKFVVTGGQLLTDFDGENFSNFAEERQDLLDFIAHHGITGVVILSGDVHFTELTKRQLTASQSIYELTSSPLSSRVDFPDEERRDHDPHRVGGTLVTDPNYCRLAIHGPADARVLTITCFDKTNSRRWAHDIREAELR